jgi:hypothetical protein
VSKCGPLGTCIEFPTLRQRSRVQLPFTCRPK